VTSSEREEKLRAVPLDAAKESPIAANSAGCADDDDVSWADVMLMIPPPHRAKVLNELCRRAHEVAQLAAEVDRLTPPPTPAQVTAARNQAYRDAIAEHYSGLDKTVAAKELAAELKRYYQGEFRHTRELPATASALQKSKHAILILSKRGPLKWRRIAQIC
jgi:hypothetical protein